MRSETRWSLDELCSPKARQPRKDCKPVCEELLGSSPFRDTLDVDLVGFPKISSPHFYVYDFTQHDFFHRLLNRPIDRKDPEWNYMNGFIQIGNNVDMKWGSMIDREVVKPDMPRCKQAEERIKRGSNLIKTDLLAWLVCNKPINTFPTHDANLCHTRIVIIVLTHILILSLLPRAPTLKWRYK